MWNSRGSKKQSQVNYLLRMRSLYHPAVIVLLEPKQPGSRIANLAASINYPRFLHCNPNNNHILILWKDSVDISLQSCSDQYLTILVSWLQSQKASYTIFLAFMLSVKRIDGGAGNLATGVRITC